MAAPEPAGAESIAVLARTRGDAAAVIAALRARGVPFSANEFALWSARERVRDLLTLTYAVAAPGTGWRCSRCCAHRGGADARWSVAFRDGAA